MTRTSPDTIEESLANVLDEGQGSLDKGEAHRDELTDAPSTIKGWETVPMGALLQFKNGVNAEKSAYGQGTPFINVLQPITKASLTHEDIPGLVSLNRTMIEEYGVRRGDVVFNRTSETAEELGLAAVYLDDTPVVFGGFVIRGRPLTERVTHRFSRYAFRTRFVRKQIVDLGQGAFRANIGQSDLRSVLVHVPPKIEQEAIAKALDDVDALITGLDRLIAKKKELKKAVMQALLTGRVRLPGFTGSWEKKRLGDSFEITSSSRVFQSQWTRDGIPFYRAREIAVHATEGEVENDLFISHELYENLKRTHGVPQAGDMLVTGVGTLGKVFVVKDESKFYFKDGNIIWFKTAGKVSSEFLRQVFLTDYMIKQISGNSVGTTVGTYTISNAKATKILLPPLQEQNAIAQVLSGMDEELAESRLKLKKAQFLRQGMMEQLLTGKVRLVKCEPA